MAKITALPGLSDATGAELVPAVRDGVTYRVPIGGLVQGSVGANLAAFSTPLTVGTCDGTGTDTTVSWSVIGLQAMEHRRLAEVRAHVSGAGVLLLQCVRSARNGGCVVVGPRIALAFDGPGVHAWGEADIVAANGGMPFLRVPGSYLAAAVPGPGAALYYTPAPLPYFRLAAEPSDAAQPLLYSEVTTNRDPASPTYGAVTGGARFDLQVTELLAPPGAAERTADLELERHDRFDMIPGHWAANSAAIDGSGRLTFSGFAGFSTRRSWGLDQIDYAVVFSGPADAQVIASTDCRLPFDSQQYEGSLCALEFAGEGGSALHVFQRYDPGGANALDFSPKDFRPLTTATGALYVPVADRRYHLSWRKDFRDQQVRCMEADGPWSWSTTITWRNGAGRPMAGYTATAYNPHTKYGLMHGAFGLGASAPCRLHSIAVTAPYDRFPLALVIGDSLTEQSIGEQGERLVDRLAARHGARRIVGSGVGGSTAGAGINRLFWLLNAMRPDVVYLRFGTNQPDASYQSLPALIELCRWAGADVRVMRFREGAGINEFIDAANVRSVDVGNALSSGNPRTVYPPYFALRTQDTDQPYGPADGDGTHWNALGVLRELDQLDAEAPINRLL